MKFKYQIITAGVVAAFLASASNASAQDADEESKKGFYTAVSAAVASVQDTTISYYDEGGTFGGTGATDRADFKADLKKSAQFGGTLGYDFGLYKDPYQRLGHLDDEMLRAMRLVVDTGIHAKGWTRDQAIKYMLDNSSKGRADATAEVERYIAMPAQALAYKIGAMTIQRLKKKAQDALGTRFDVRNFHAQVLMTGALPMGVLEKKIDDWTMISRGK